MRPTNIVLFWNFYAKPRPHGMFCEGYLSFSLWGLFVWTVGCSSSFGPQYLLARTESTKSLGSTLPTIQINMKPLTIAVSILLANIRKKGASLGKFLRRLPLGH